MKDSVQVISNAVKKLKFQPLYCSSWSFNLVIGKKAHGKSSLLKQANLKQIPFDYEIDAELFYNQHGAVLELGECWLIKPNVNLNRLFKQINRCTQQLKVTGILLCVDISEMLIAEPLELTELTYSYTQLLTFATKTLRYPVKTSLIFTKLDTLAGFCEFFQTEHAVDLKEPLGFSLSSSNDAKKRLVDFRRQLDLLVDSLSQRIIRKLHPARSNAKRTLIREFPLQLATIRMPVQILLQRLPLSTGLESIYFTSAAQGGLSIDCLNKKIQHEYGLIVQDRYPQSNNYRAFFIEGTVCSFQHLTKSSTSHRLSGQQIIAGATAVSVAVLGLFLVSYQHLLTANHLEGAKKELSVYETLINQTGNMSTALYHLTLAENQLDAIQTWPFSIPLVERIKAQLHHNAEDKLHRYFLPNLVRNLENILENPAETLLDRYQALKIYLMLAKRERFSQSEVIHWFSQYQLKQNPNSLDDKPTVVLKTALQLPLQTITINKQLVADVRNYLNALPATYLYYSLAKVDFPKQTIPIGIEGFDLAVKEIPYYYTKPGFNEVLAVIPHTVTRLQQENWVLARQDLEHLQSKLEQAYFNEYVTWWKNFIQRTQPQHYQGTQQARQLIQILSQKQVISRLIGFIQQNTRPEPNENSQLFNKKIASHFTNINLLTTSTNQELTNNLVELGQFLTTLSLVNDEGQTIFELTKARFSGSSQSDPLSKLYSRSHQLPEPIASWAKQIADDSWFIFISTSKGFINKQWHKKVYQVYSSTIANRYPIDYLRKEEITLEDFNRFFAPRGILNQFVEQYLSAFLNTSQPQWASKELDGYVLPMSNEILNELIRANVISNMFFPKGSSSKIDFSLQKISLDPVVSSLQLSIGHTMLTDNQSSDSYTFFKWPESDAKLNLTSIEGNHFELEEKGVWAFFKILQKVNVLVDNEDSSSLQILFEVNGNSGRYILKTENQINPFSPGVLTGFNLTPNLA